MTAKEFLKEKGIKDTLYNVEKDDGSWIKGGLSELLEEYARLVNQKPWVNELKNEDVYDLLAKINNLVETERHNVWVKTEPNTEPNWVTTYRLTKLGFEVKHKYIPVNER